MSARDPVIADALARLPDYLGQHVLVSFAALALGLLISLPLARPAPSAVSRPATTTTTTGPVHPRAALTGPIATHSAGRHSSVRASQ